MRKWSPLLAICLGTFMLLIDVTITTVALPDMASDLKTSLSDLEWVVDIYALALAALLLGVGSSADRLGRRAVYLAGLVVFAVASLVCGIAGNVEVLIIARLVQGIGAAGMFGTTIALLGAHYAGKDRGVAFAVWGATNAVAAAAGPIVGGLLTEYLSWRWIFFVNLPVSLIAVLMTVRVVRESKNPTTHKLDSTGIVTFTVASGALTIALIRAHVEGWTSFATLGLLGLAVIALAAFIVAELRHAYPLLDLSLFRRPSFSGIMVGAMLAQGGAFAYLIYTSLWLQTVLGYSPVKAGLFILPLSIAAFVLSALSARLGPWKPKFAIGVGLLFIAAGCVLQGFLHTNSTGSAIILGLTVSGIGVGMVTPSLGSAALTSVPPERGGMAGGAVNTFRQLGYAVGIAVFGVVFQSRIEHVLRADGRIPNSDHVAAALSGGQAHYVIAQTPAADRGSVIELVHKAFASGLSLTVIVAGAVSLAAALVVFALVNTPATAPEDDETMAGNHAVSV